MCCSSICLSFFRLLFIFAGLATVLFAWTSEEIMGFKRENKGEFFALTVMLTAAMCVMAEARDLLMLFLSMEGVGDPGDRPPEGYYVPMAQSDRNFMSIAVSGRADSQELAGLVREATGSLDAKNAGAIGTLLFELHREAGNILITVTHSADLASRFERGLELREGRCFEP